MSYSDRIWTPDSGPFRPPMPVVDGALARLRRDERDRWRHVRDPRVERTLQMAVGIGSGTPTRSLAIPGAPGTGGTSASWTLSGTNLAIMLAIATFDGTSNQTVSLVSWSLGSGTPVEVKTISRGGGSHIFIWVIPAPVAGAGTYTVTLAQSQQYQITATYFTGCDQTTPCPTGDATTVSIDGTPVTLTPTNLTANDASYGGSASDSQNPIGVTPNQTYLDNTTTINLQAGYATGTTGVTFDYSAAGAGQAIAAARIVTVGGGGAPSLPPSQIQMERPFQYSRGRR